MASDKKWIWKNLIGAAVFVCVLLFGSAVGLKIVTRHGKTVQAPDFTNMTVKEAEAAASAGHVSVKVVDSVFVKRLSAGVVYRQSPKPGSTVKKGRSIFLTINSIVPRKVVMPNLYGYSVTQAGAELKNRGLVLGKLNYVKDIATNNVLGQSSEGRNLTAGDLVVSGSVIDLKVGVNSSDNSTTVPRLSGMNYVSAVDALHDRFLNLGKVTYDSGIRTYADSMAAVVYKQTEPVGAGRSLGSSVGISLTLDKSKLPE